MRLSGFTLLEVMLVIVIMGLVVSVVMFNTFGQSKQDELKRQAQRFQVVFNMVADFSILNQQQLGLRVNKDNGEYLFMRLDDEQVWRIIEDEKFLAAHQLPEPFKLELQLDDLPWQEERLFDDGIFDEALSFSDDDIQIGDEEEKRPPPPQVLILSSGDITPFSLSFIFDGEFSREDPVYFKVNGEDTPPLSLDGPLARL